MKTAYFIKDVSSNCFYRISLVCYKGHKTLRQDSYLTNPGWLVLMIVPILFYICFAASALFCKVMILFQMASSEEKSSKNTKYVLGHGYASTCKNLRLSLIGFRLVN